MEMQTDNREQWETPELQFKGSVGDVLNTGGGKLSIKNRDPGSSRCHPVPNRHPPKCNN
jgi:hypothetical protein